MYSFQKKTWLTLLGVSVFFLISIVTGCITQRPADGALHRWWSGLGPVLPHDTFPADCNMCHLGRRWNELREEFAFDHERETGYRLEGAHRDARCLRCHNDRGPVATFTAKGCVGCHEDYHEGSLGKDCASCHDQDTWYARRSVEAHNRTRFPLTGAHLATSCHRCHEGAWVGKFRPVDTNCVTCHVSALERAINPPHIALGWTDRCDKCHIPTRWDQARVR